MILFLKTEQLSLFDAPVIVGQHTRKDGVTVAAHTRVQKVAFHTAPHVRPVAEAPVKRTKLDAFIDAKGGVGSLGAVLTTMTDAQRAAIFAQMASIGDKTADEVAAMFPKTEVDRKQTGSKPEAISAHNIVEHVTKNGAGKTIRGIIRTDLTLAEAKEIDPYTFRKDGGFFIREKHLTGAPVAGAETAPEVPAEVPIAAKRTKRVNVPGEGAHTVVTMADGSTKRIQKLSSGESMGVPGWHDLDGGEHSFLGDSQEAAIATLDAAHIAPPPATAAEPEPTTPAPVAVDHDPLAPFGVPAGVSKAKRRDINSAVIAALDTPSPDPKLLRQYSGNGGCGDSLNEFYTDPDVARAMWTAIGSLRLTHGTALEPSCGSGVYLHTAPAGFKVTGVELEPISAQVAQVLHGDRHEVVNSSLERFATMDNRQFDVVVGNPPYGPRGRLAKDDKKMIANCEQYFTDTALDKCKSDGIVALVVPVGIMDSSTARTFRLKMLRKGEFLGAQRMPNTAFEHSHTEVTTDVIFLRKRPQDVAGALTTLTEEQMSSLGILDNEFVDGNYFTGRGAENVLGTMTEGWRAKAGMGQDITVEGSMSGVADAIAAFTPDVALAGGPPLTVSRILDSVDGEREKARVLSGAAYIPYAFEAKVGDTKVIDGVTYVLQGDPPRWNRVDEFLESAAISDAREVAARIESAMETGDATGLKEAVDEYVKKHGIPAANPELLIAANLDKVLYRMVGAVNKKGELSDLVSGRTRVVEGGFDATAQILTLDRDDGLFTPDELAERLGKPVGDVIEQLAADARYAYAGDGQWASMDVYLTGELWPKLDAAKKEIDSGASPEFADKLAGQVSRLESLIGEKSLDDVDIGMNSAFIPTDILGAFLTWRNHEGPLSNEWTKKIEPITVSFANGAYTVAHHGDHQSDLVGKYLNRTGIRRETEKPTIDAMNEEFKAWLCASAYRDEIEAKYNRSFRGYVAPKFSDVPIDVPGMSTEKKVKSFRWSSLRRSLAQGKGIIADDVGLGKTVAGLLLARMSKIQGAAKRPIITCPKSVLANWFVEAETWFPGARVLTIGATYVRGADGALIGRDDGPSERDRKWHDLMQNDYDFVIVSDPSFQAVDLNPILKEQYYGDDFWNERGDSLKGAGTKKRNAIRENHDQAVARRELGDHTDAVYFDMLGIDMMICDEMHSKKNLYAAKARWSKQPKFLGGSGQSGRALDFNLKTRFVREHNKGKGVFGLTATPTSNSPLEIYSMLSHIAPEAFEAIGIRNSEEFIDRFCEFEDDKILSTGGAIEDALVVSGFKNMDEVREIMSKYVDRRTAVQVGLELPKRDDRMHLVDMNPAQKMVYSELRELADRKLKSDDPNAQIFRVMSDMTKAATDLELYDPTLYAGAPSPKFDLIAQECAKGAKEGGQLVFCESIDSHEKIVAALVAAGIKRSEIGIINAKVASGSTKRLAIADALNAGKLKVVVGNCTMAEGLNMQKTTTDIHHVDVPWTPAILQQRNGRGLRQGNTRDAVRIHSYLSKGSFDGYRYQSVMSKKDWQDSLWNGGDKLDNLSREGNMDRDEMRIALAADPEKAKEIYDADKTEAQRRLATGKRVDAQKAYIKLTEMNASYAALKNKKTESANRLRGNIEAKKTQLLNNVYFPAKAALDKGGDVLIHPQSGTVLEKNVGLDLGEDGKAVVDGIDMRAGTVKIRRYADTSGGRGIWQPMDALANAKPFKFDAGAEAKEMQEHFEKVATENLNTLKDYKSVARMPSAVLEANQELIQRQMKDGAKAYKFAFPYGNVPMVDRATGALKMAESFEHTKLHETHDYMLPTDANKEKLAQAWMASERDKRFADEYVQGGRRSQGKIYPRIQYPDAKYASKNHNPWLAAYTDAHAAEGASYSHVASPVKKELTDRFATEQLARVRRAKTFKDSLVEAIPLTEMSEYNHDTNVKPKWNAKALTMLWARARREGALDKDVQSSLPQVEAYAGRMVKKHHNYLMHDSYHGNDQTVHGTLLRLAQGSGHRDLADAMVQAQAKRKSV